MKVLQINSVCGFGSTGRITTDLYHMIEEHGHECCIAYGRKTAPEGYQTLRIGSDLDVYRHALFTRLSDRTAFASKKATEKFIQEVKEYKPDIIHMHNIHGYYINLERLFEYFSETKIPVIWTLHDCWSFTGHCCHFDYIGCNKWKSCCYQCEQKKNYPTSYLCDNSKGNYLRKKAIITGCDNILIVSPSKWLAGLVKESYLNQFPSVVIPNGIDLNQFKPTPSDLREKYQLEDNYIVLGVSNGFSKSKGLEYFTKLAYNLPSNFKLILIGVDKNQKHYLPNQVLTLPRTNNVSELAQFYTMADVFVNPTLEETQGLTNIEALACGTGVVTFNSGGCPESIDESCGFIVERDDLKGLIKAVIRACKKPFDRNACTHKALLYDKARLFGQYVTLYENFLNTINQNKTSKDPGQTFNDPDITLIQQDRISINQDSTSKDQDSTSIKQDTTSVKQDRASTDKTEI